MYLNQLLECEISVNKECARETTRKLTENARNVQQRVNIREKVKQRPKMSNANHEQNTEKRRTETTVHLSYVERSPDVQVAQQQQEHCGREEEREAGGSESGQRGVAAVPVVAEAVLNVVGAEHSALRLQHLVVAPVHAVPVPPNCWHLQPVQRRLKNVTNTAARVIS